ncbi:MAG: hypothetical protein KatS3mg019_0539 [Fimbriimonadales bacterium]|nr:MAG: hypothetical protein KatS3mg019_0539 [Fimbriimonadales bacterium]
MLNRSEGKQSWGAPAPHLSAEQIMELAERGRRSRRYDEWIDHITECLVCRETYKQLLQAESAVRAARRPTRTVALRFLLPAAAAAMLILFFGARELFSGGAPMAGLRQQGGVWYEGALRLPDWAADAAAQFLHPPTAATRDALGAAPRAVRLNRPNPANAAIESLAPEFEWTPVTDAVRYRAWLEHADGRRAFNLEVNGTRATLPDGARLEAGAQYRLVIESLASNELPGEGLTSVYEFRVLTNEEQTRLRWARANRQNAPRTCAVIFYQLGFYAEALETLERLPNEPLVSQWWEAIRATSATTE